MNTEHGGSQQPADIPSGPEPRPQGPIVIWRVGEPFDTARSTIARIITRTATTYHHPLFGDGVAYKISADGGVAPAVEIFPDRAALHVFIPDAPAEYQTRQYLIDRITVSTTQNGIDFVSIAAIRKSGASTINIFADGEIQELHYSRFPISPLNSDSSRGDTGIVADGKRSYSVREAADLAGVHPTTLTAALRKGRLSGKKVGRDWIVDAEAAERFRRSPRGRRPKY